MSKLNLGQFPPAPLGQKDAVHVAVVVVTSHEVLQPGQRVQTNLTPGYVASVRPNSKKFVGVVDPFLDHPTSPYQEFLVCLTPGTVTDLRHEWSHPDFSTPELPDEVNLDDTCRGC